MRVLASSLDLANVLGISEGGTNSSATPTAGGVAYGTGTAYALTAAGTSGQFLKSAGAGAPSFATLAAGDIPNLAASKITSGTFAVNRGGTGATTFTANGVLLGNTTSAIQATAAGSANQVLRVPSGGGAPAFGSIDLTSSAAVAGTLPIANGGTNATATPTAGGVSYGTGSAYAFTSAGTSQQVLKSAGSSAPTWGDLQGSVGTAGSTFALAATDIGDTILLQGSNLGVTTVTIPTNATVAFPVGTRFLVQVTNTKNLTTGGSVVISPAGGVTLNGGTSDLTFNWDASGVLIKTATNTWEYIPFGPPVGTIQLYSGAQSDIPTGYFLCDGSAKSRTTYYRLYQVIGTRYGTGDGSTTFNLPSQSDKILKAISTSSDTPGNTHTTGAQSAAHTHTIASVTSTESTTHTHDYLGGNTSKTSTGQSVNHTHTVGGNTGNESANHTHSFNVVAMNLIIRAW